MGCLLSHGRNLPHISNGENNSSHSAAQSTARAVQFLDTTHSLCGQRKLGGNLAIPVVYFAPHGEPVELGIEHTI